MKKNKWIISIVIIVMIIIAMVILNWQKNNGNMEIYIGQITIIGVIINLILIWNYYFLTKKFTTPYIIFQMLSIPFLYGQTLCRYVFNVEVDIFDLNILVSMQNLIDASILIIFCQLSMHLGILLFMGLYKKKKNLDLKVDMDKEVVVLKKIGIILLMISIVPTFVEFYNNLNVALSLGYSGVRANSAVFGWESISIKLIPFFYMALLFLLVGFKENKYINKGILIFILFFYGAQMFFGERGTPLLNIIGAVWLYNVAVKKINKKVIIVLLILIIPVSMLINTLRIMRNYGLNEWIFDFKNIVIENSQKNNPILETFYEIGTAIYPTAYAIKVCPEELPFRYGITYLYSIYSIININTSSNSASDLKSEMNVAIQITTLAGSPFGGSYIQESFANFGWYSVIFMFFASLLFLKMEYLMRSEKYINLILLAYFMTSLLWIIRNTVVALPREIAWYILPTYFLYVLINNKYLKLKRGKV